MVDAAAQNDSETPEQKLARLEQENADLRNAQSAPGLTPGSETDVHEVEAPTILAPLQALAQSVSEKPDATFVQHLEKLAADGVKAVISPSVEADVHAVIAALVADIVKVKL